MTIIAERMKEYRLLMNALDFVWFLEGQTYDGVLTRWLEHLIEFFPGQSLPDVQSEYHERLYQAMSDYLQSDRPITSFRNEFRRVVNDGFTFAFIAGWVDGGASGPISDDAQSWLNSRIEQEVAFADGLFSQLKELRDEDLPLMDKLAAAESHAAAYTMTTQSVYEQGKLMARPEIDLTFAGPDGSSDSVCQKNSGTCVQLKGQKHPASWWVEHDLLPRRGNPNYDCGCWNCRHYLIDKDGTIWASAEVEYNP